MSDLRPALPAHRPRWNCRCEMCANHYRLKGLDMLGAAAEQPERRPPIPKPRPGHCIGCGARLEDLRARCCSHACRQRIWRERKRVAAARKAGGAS